MNHDRPNDDVFLAELVEEPTLVMPIERERPKARVQFSLRQLMIATAMIAVLCAIGRTSVTAGILAGFVGVLLIPTTARVLAAVQVAKLAGRQFYFEEYVTATGSSLVASATSLGIGWLMGTCAFIVVYVVLGPLAFLARITWNIDVAMFHALFIGGAAIGCLFGLYVAAMLLLDSWPR